MNQYSTFTSTAGGTVTQTTYNPNNYTDVREVKTKPIASGAPSAIAGGWVSDVHLTGGAGSFYVDGTLYPAGTPIPSATSASSPSVGGIVIAAGAALAAWLAWRRWGRT